MIFTPMQPIVAVDWEKVQSMRVTVEQGKLRFRCGTTMPRRNLQFDARVRGSTPFLSGEPIYYPHEGIAEAGTDHDTFIMSASMNSTVMVRGEEANVMTPIQDPTAQAAFQAFGYFYAPLTESDGLVGFTLSKERERIAAFWGWYKMPPGDGTQHPPMNRLGPPNIPYVALRPLNMNGNPIKIDGEEVVIRPREFFDFDNAAYYDTTYAPTPAVATSDSQVAQAIELLTKLVASGNKKV